MTRFPTIQPEAATGAASELLAAVQRALGVTPNMTKVMANSPALLKGYLGLSAALAGGTLDAGVRERIAVTIAEYNACEYCLSAHTYVGANVAGVTADELHHARHAHSSDPKTHAVLTLADNVARHRGEVDDTVLDDVRAAGLSDAEILETVGHVALNVLTNYANKLTQVDNDWPVVTPGEQAA